MVFSECDEIYHDELYSKNVYQQYLIIVENLISINNYFKHWWEFCPIILERGHLIKFSFINQIQYNIINM